MKVLSKRIVGLEAAQKSLHENMLASIENRSNELNCANASIEREAMFLSKEKLWLKRILQEERRQSRREQEAQELATSLGRNYDFRQKIRHF